MIESIEFKNYKALRQTTLPLAPFTLLLGPNGSGKSSVLNAIEGISNIIAHREYKFLPERAELSDVNLSDMANWVVPTVESNSASVGFAFNCRWCSGQGRVSFDWINSNRLLITSSVDSIDGGTHLEARKELREKFAKMSVYRLDPARIAAPVQVNSEPLKSDGTGLAAVLDDLKDNHPEHWERLLVELREWLPEFDHIQFVKPNSGQKAIALRTKRGNHMIPASELSQGTLVALALLTLAYQPNPPSLIGLEEIDRGLHPRLLRHLQDALYRLSYPESCGEKRPPIQVIATTHSPYLLDLYRDHPEEVVLAQKEGLEVQFKQLSQIEHFNEILGNSPLSEVWYSGVFGGVAVKP